MRKLIVIFMLACSPALHAASLQYDFSYTFNDGEQLYGSLMGTLLGDGDTIQVDAVTDLHYTAPLRNDCCFPDFSYPVSYCFARLIDAKPDEHCHVLFK